MVTKMHVARGARAGALLTALILTQSAAARGGTRTGIARTPE
jgi:hypothetical protein